MVDNLFYVKKCWFSLCFPEVSHRKKKKLFFPSDISFGSLFFFCKPRTKIIRSSNSHHFHIYGMHFVFFMSPVKIFKCHKSIVGKLYFMVIFLFQCKVVASLF